LNLLRVGSKSFFAAAQIAVVLNYYLRVEQAAARWCSKTNYCARVEGVGSLEAPSLTVHVRPRKAPMPDAVRSDMEAAGVLRVPRNPEDPAGKATRIVVVLAAEVGQRERGQR
jgi:hypothetical protein